MAEVASYWAKGVEEVDGVNLVAVASCLPNLESEVAALWVNPWA